MGISQLAQGLVDHGGIVRIWLHDAPWVDVNDRVAIDRAELLVATHPEIFAGDGLFATPDHLESQPVAGP